MDIGLGIGMAIMFLVTNLFIVLIMRITLMSNFDYKAGMYLGVHIPAEHKEDAEVAALMEKTKKQFDNENQHFRFIDFDPIIQEFTTAHKENNRKYLRVNSNSVKTALRIIKMCGDNRVKLCYDEVAFYKYPLLMLFEHGVFIIKNEGNEL